MSDRLYLDQAIDAKEACKGDGRGSGLWLNQFVGVVDDGHFVVP